LESSEEENMIKKAVSILFSMALVCVFLESPVHLRGDTWIQEDEPVPEVLSLLGKKLYATPATEEELNGLKKNLKEALRQLELNPEDVENIISYGGRLANLWRYHEAIDVYTKGIEKFPENAMLFRHRGHRYISVRNFKQAVEDLIKASQLNSRDFDIWYHLGLAYYLQGEFGLALKAYQECAKYTVDDDARVAVSYWLYITMRRLNQDKVAAKVLKNVTNRMNIMVEQSYHKLMVFYQGKISEKEILAMASASDLDTATYGYGVGVLLLFSNQGGRAVQVFEKILELRHWPAFGYIAAEAELARLIKE
jgi:tetratricopeptide (TPR) repeat protein